MEPHCKIGKVKLRNGAEVRVYDNKSPFMCSAMRKTSCGTSGKFTTSLPDWPDMSLLGGTGLEIT